ncbi:MAG: DUF2161 family putative PD-(D/E)XK-type phosphodiesterase [Defluviitaleaceae bacterium]|nr:DUF2161 family putative PD-(D/E)XK-type phosphodiesterase [Defluviitaleaceae bacterium]MCL2275368.1 DUF2161 family putative PD-(D/E)XK-type phosphodiesterase [Defluviitaleaceae bacterium]
MKTAYKETDLYDPIRRLLTEQGFTVRGEVKGCDIAAVKDDALWIIEMKLTASLKLIFQAMARQDATDWVFAAIPRPQKARDKHYIQYARLLKRAGIGLITVSLDSPMRLAEIMHFPTGKDVKTNKKTAQIKKEIAGRAIDTRGGTKAKVNTAYREKCIRIAAILEENAPLNAPALIKTYGCEGDTYTILRTNFYGWYEKAGRGLYALSGKGIEFLQENETQSLIIYYRMKAKIIENAL